MSVTKPPSLPENNGAIPRLPTPTAPAAASSPGSKSGRGRKRSHPSDAMDDGAPPNVKLPTAIMQQQKQMLYKRVAEAERSPFFLHPHQVTSIYPFLSLSPSVAAAATAAGTPTGNSPGRVAGNFSPGVYPLVQQSPPNQLGLTMVNQMSSILTPPSSVSTSTTLTTQASSATTNVVVSSIQPPPTAATAGGGGGGVLTSLAAPGTPPRAPYSAQFYAPFVKCPVSPPTPSGIATLSVLSPWNIAAMSQIGISSPPTNPSPSSLRAKRGSGGGGGPVKRSQTPTQSHNNNNTSRGNVLVGPGAATTTTSAHTAILPQHILSPRAGFTSIQSPLGYLHPSPLSPMMLIQSPYASSVSSCPSVSSSSGCSSDGGASFTTNLHVKNYAPSEYHVGPRRPLSEKLTEEDIVSEGGNSSGRNTPIDPLNSDEDHETDTTPHQNIIVYPLQEQHHEKQQDEGQTSNGTSGGENNMSQTFTQFSITAQGPSIVQPGTPMSHSSSGSTTPHLKPGQLGRGVPVASIDLTSSSNLPTNSLSTPGTSSHHMDTVAYPYSVESGTTSSIHPMSEDSSQGYVSSVLQISSSGERPSSGVSSMSSSLSSRESTPDPEETEPLPPPHATSSILSRDPHANLSTNLGRTVTGDGPSGPGAGLIAGGGGGATLPNHHHHPHHASQGSDTFCLVPGRLSLLSSTQKYKVTVDEVRRRLSHPECLNASVLGGILRRAKSKNGGHVLRQRLDSIGLSLPPGRRKATELSLLTSLVEGEAEHLSSDFRRICETYFPHTELAQIIARQHVGTPQAQHRVSMVKAAQLVISELQAMLNAVGGPSNIKANDPNNPYPGLTNFSLLSHGFGNPAINTSLSVVQTYLQELLAFYDGRKTVQPENRFMTFGGDKIHSSGGAQFVNGMPHSVYAGQISVPNSDLAHHGRHSSSSMKQEPVGSPSRHATL